MNQKTKLKARDSLKVFSFSKFSSGRNKIRKVDEGWAVEEKGQTIKNPMGEGQVGLQLDEGQ